jgi:2-dehydro-3-deoxygluconokinase
MEQLDVITFGEAMAMFIANEQGPLHEVNQYTRSLAGAETNVAIGLARLGFSSGWASKVGNDSFGKYIIQRLREENVHIGHVLVDGNYPTGFQVKSKVVVGDPEVQYFRKGSAASQMDVSDLKEDYFLQARHMHITGIPLALSDQMREFAQYALELMNKNNRTVSFDPNLRPTLWKSKREMINKINDTAYKSDTFLPGLAEGEILTGFSDPQDIASFYLDKGVKLVIIKLGEEGAFYKTAAEEGFVKGFPVENVIDTVGAGDGFAVGVLSGLVEGYSVEKAVMRGNAIGALAVQSPGDHEGYPTRKQLEEYMKQQLEGVK